LSQQSRQHSPGPPVSHDSHWHGHWQRPPDAVVD
jgi:hypothetical protein